eukprot:TRINITY_DN2478_c0_g1_i1.p1 TRINITY_DN2478_c0_g1~~TRINITY_DN2478_c0_g1_i1.p1  ORF type:complete len:169 (-),score=34.61 TRINITY_DN2478_c0_g1_i1:251-757(-)
MSCFKASRTLEEVHEEAFGVELPAGYRPYYTQARKDFPAAQPDEKPAERRARLKVGRDPAFPDLFSVEPFRKMYWFHTLQHVQDEDDVGFCDCDLGFYEIEGHFSREVERIITFLTKRNWILKDQQRETEDFSVKLEREEEVRALKMRVGPVNSLTGLPLVGLLVSTI